MTKKVLSIVLSLVMLLGMVPLAGLTAFAIDEKCDFTAYDAAYKKYYDEFRTYDINPEWIRKIDADKTAVEAIKKADPPKSEGQTAVDAATALINEVINGLSQYNRDYYELYTITLKGTKQTDRDAAESTTVTVNTAEPIQFTVVDTPASVNALVANVAGQVQLNNAGAYTYKKGNYTYVFDSWTQIIILPSWNVDNLSAKYKIQKFDSADYTAYDAAKARANGLLTEYGNNLRADVLASIQALLTDPASDGLNNANTDKVYNSGDLYGASAADVAALAAETKVINDAIDDLFKNIDEVIVPDYTQYDIAKAALDTVVKGADLTEDVIAGIEEIYAAVDTFKADPTLTKKEIQEDINDLTDELKDIIAKIEDKDPTILNKYTATFNYRDVDGTEATKIVTDLLKGDDVSLEAPAVEPYFFNSDDEVYTNDGWDPVLNAIEKDTVYTMQTTFKADYTDYLAKLAAVKALDLNEEGQAAVDNIDKIRIDGMGVDEQGVVDNYNFDFIDPDMNPQLFNLYTVTFKANGAKVGTGYTEVLKDTALEAPEVNNFYDDLAEKSYTFDFWTGYEAGLPATVGELFEKDAAKTLELVAHFTELADYANLNALLKETEGKELTEEQEDILSEIIVRIEAGKGTDDNEAVEALAKEINDLVNVGPAIEAAEEEVRAEIPEDATTPVLDKAEELLVQLKELQSVKAIVERIPLIKQAVNEAYELAVEEAKVLAGQALEEQFDFDPIDDKATLDAAKVAVNSAKSITDVEFALNEGLEIIKVAQQVALEEAKKEAADKINGAINDNSTQYQLAAAGDAHKKIADAETKAEVKKVTDKAIRNIENLTPCDHYVTGFCKIYNQFINIPILNTIFRIIHEILHAVKG